MREPVKKKIEALREKIRKHDYLYYIISEPKISDKEYDDLLLELKGLEEKYPEFRTDDSPTLRVSGGVLAGFKTVRHRHKMLSLDNTYSFDELVEWRGRVLKGLGGKENIEYVVELKIDGVSASLTYKNGKLSVGATRGDGETGEDITANIQTIRAIPLSLSGKSIPDLVEIRGEVYMDRKDFEILNFEKEQAKDAIFANPRNATSGSLKLLDRGVVAKRRLNFFAHSLGEYQGVDFKTHWEFLEKLRFWGVRVNRESRIFNDFDEVLDYCKTWQEKRERISYDIDGMVIKVNSLKQQNTLGFTLKSPRWAVAYKFPARQATTEVLKINIQVGRTGVITPVAELKPVECAGVVIKHATLHNFDEMKRLNIKEGDRVLIERAGDVIPKVVKVVENKGKKTFAIPRSCPVCHGKVVKEKEGDVAYRCINPSCPAQLERGLMHFSSRQAMDIQGLGEVVIKQLVSLHLVRDFSDIYKLKKEDLLKLELFKDKKADNLIRAIQESKLKPLSRLIYALGIRHVGEKAADVLAQRFLSMDSIMSAKKDDLDRIHEVGPVMSSSIVDYFSPPQTRILLEKLRHSGLNFMEHSRLTKTTALSGKTVVFTGELKRYSRREAQELVRAMGANAVSSVSKNTDFVVAGENPGSKYGQAEKLGVKIMNEEEFRRLL